MNKKNLLVLFLFAFILPFYSENMQAQSSETDSITKISLQMQLEKTQAILNEGNNKIKELRLELEDVRNNLKKTQRTDSLQNDSLRNNRETMAKVSVINDSIEHFLKNLPSLPAIYNKQLATIDREQINKQYYRTITMCNTFLSPSQQREYKAPRDTIVNVYLVKTYFDNACALLGRALNSDEYEKIEDLSTDLDYFYKNSPIQAVHKEELKRLSKLLNKYTDEQKRLNKILEKIADKLKEAPPTSELKSLLEKETAGENAFEKEYVFLNNLIEQAGKTIEKKHIDRIDFEKLKIEIPK